MATSILAVDDSVTMRKILEITFAGTDYNVVVVRSGDEAVARLRDGGFGLVICDNSLEQNGYEVAKQMKSTAPSVPILFLSSRQNPFDAAQGSAARIDDHIDKPFDTQQLIDRATKLASGASAGIASVSPAASAQSPAPPAAAAASPQGFAGAVAKGRTIGYGGAGSATSGVNPAAGQPKAAGFGAGSALGAKPAPSAAPAARPAPPPPAPPPPAAQARPAAAAAVSAAAGAVNGHLAAKMGELGLTPQQADAVMAISREVVERVVWEVVPVLAEALIKEEIARLTR